MDRTVRKRKAITKKLAVDALLLSVAKQFGRYLKCPLSGEDMKPGDQIQFDHIHAHALDGPHVYDNLRPVLADPHKKKSKADLRMIKKTRPPHTDKFVIKRTTTPTPGGGMVEWTLEEVQKPKPKRKRKWPKRSFQRKPKR